LLVCDILGRSGADIRLASFESSNRGCEHDPLTGRREKNMGLGLEDAVTVLNKWKDDSAQILLVSESPFQQSRRGILQQGIDWANGLQDSVEGLSQS
jgi:hypothetical protein